MDIKKTQPMNKEHNEIVEEAMNSIRILADRCEIEIAECRKKYNWEDADWAKKRLKRLHSALHKLHYCFK